MSQIEFITSGAHWPIFQEHIWRYDFASKYAEDKVVLDVASGAGYGSLYLAKIGKARKVFGVDYDKRAIEYSKRYYNSKKIDFMISDATNLPFKNEFDLIVSFETIEHINNYKKFISECYRCLNPGGHLVISTPNKFLSPHIKPRIWHHDHEFYPKEFFDLFENFSKIDFFCQRPINPAMHLLKVQSLYLASHLTTKKPFSIILSSHRERKKSNLNEEKKVLTAEELSEDILVNQDFDIKPFFNSILKMPRYILGVAKK
jgi:SAM-dependent methyltransferase